MPIFRQHYRVYLYMKIEDINRNNEKNKCKLDLCQILFMFDIILHANIYTVVARRRKKGIDKVRVA